MSYPYEKVITVSFAIPEEGKPQQVRLRRYTINGRKLDETYMTVPPGVTRKGVARRARKWLASLGRVPLGVCVPVHFNGGLYLDGSRMFV